MLLPPGLGLPPGERPSALWRSAGAARTPLSPRVHPHKRLSVGQWSAALGGSLSLTPWLLHLPSRRARHAGVAHIPPGSYRGLAIGGRHPPIPPRRGRDRERAAPDKSIFPLVACDLCSGNTNTAGAVAPWLRAHDRLRAARSHSADTLPGPATSSWLPAVNSAGAAGSRPIAPRPQRTAPH
jgi:hypothetical protein